MRNEIDLENPPPLLNQVFWICTTRERKKLIMKQFNQKSDLFRRITATEVTTEKERSGNLSIGHILELRRGWTRRNLRRRVFRIGVQGCVGIQAGGNNMHGWL